MPASTLNGLLQEAVTYANSSKYRKSSDKYKELYQMTAIDVVPLNQNHIGYPLRYHSLSGEKGDRVVVHGLYLLIAELFSCSFIEVIDDVLDVYIQH